MAQLQFFGYDKCSTCRKARQWLEAHDRGHQFIDITEQPPTQAQLERALQTGDYELKHLFNTSGQLYQQMNLKDKLPHMSRNEALALLARHGKLVKRPIVTDGQRVTVGFKPERFEQTWG